MKSKDVKTLWGRAGGRCSFPKCRIELTAEGIGDTLGEIAHIVSRSQTGPRGNITLSIEKRDEYGNLILLCPTHHKLVDSNEEEWAVERLNIIKHEHEQWVLKRLDEGNISERKIDNSNFLELREHKWKQFVKDKVWIVFCITPLNISGDNIDPLDKLILDSLNTHKLPDAIADPYINSHKTHPDPNGLTNENLEDEDKGIGHKISIFRSGHAEYLLCINAFIEKTTSYDKQTKHPLSDSLPKNGKVFHYNYIALAFENQIEFLISLWKRCFPFYNMQLSAHIFNTQSSILFSEELAWSIVHGFEIKENKLEYSTIIDKDIETAELLMLFLKRFSNYFGLELNSLYNNKGKFTRPHRIFR